MSFFYSFDNRQYVSAHRGNRSIRPENSLCAFTASIGCCDFIEVDVQMSRDGVAVIHHDEVLGRTSNGAELATRLGKPSLRLDSWDLAELRQLDIGSWFLTVDPFATISQGMVSPDDRNLCMSQTIMTLSELLNWAKNSRIPLNVEIKDQEGGRHDSTIVDTVLAAVASADYTESTLISSFRHDYLRQVKQKMPQIAIGVLQEEEHPDNLLQYLAALDAQAYHPDVEITTPELIRELRGGGFGVNIFTVNDPAIGRDLFSFGATAIFSDFPRLFRPC
ncbi:glycerophosphodiester phosphodiesterase [Desulfopila aestuarii]|uniref:Glycerophosphoryl diester phosphodiesterase n=1 Tax=Desulfopila aestuarii DSM 18488 TaxID=1121416 RepID=A0A1M7XXK0_9BACT|nr:glycerophosphodiester phosphodiesterase family protein [Desulfopila aestuarii]SHO43643.1 glycerophosphoryl diester phosphodiesterase [Desulfopila aestuarii DSM 18488]